uniref:Uncharacterized protein n=1 Tax=Heterorhabditis bacteriophora TaxID=37862 RepID=A0A1I7WI78_HETBA
MTYDFRGKEDVKTGFHSPLFSAENESPKTLNTVNFISFIFYFQMSHEYLKYILEYYFNKTTICMFNVNLNLRNSLVLFLKYNSNVGNSSIIILHCTAIYYLETYNYRFATNVCY